MQLTSFIPKQMYSLVLSLLAFITYIQAYRPLSNDSLKKVWQVGQPEALSVDHGAWLHPLLIERVSGSPGNIIVRDTIINHFKKMNWTIELDTFTAETPLGDKEFTNIIVTKEPQAQRRLVLAAHFDSMNSDFPFIGATDSAVPCAVLMSLGATLNDHLPMQSDWSGGRRKTKLPEQQTTLQLMFFDGEEAFVSWTHNDSIYGARHLAETWEKTPLPHYPPTVKASNKLDQIDVLVLLDLMGTPNLTFHNYFRSTSWLFQHLVALEKKLFGQSDDMWAKKTKDGVAIKPMFPDQPTYLTFESHAMQDDHLPFMERGVHILHLIPHPFPAVWHKPTDDAAHLDPPSIANLDILFRAFVCEYLELDPIAHGEL
ncbi:hypothetical protein DM01DRAFT_1330988 [Hesseltinella vesiculosa]|uniref:Peptide hydrolase n=1 Tax=Hesseltinella vesiculosa TaxID=101127 RepID=A0A1X2GXR4_9FUNG|nr:hypothetical protein DM01DRAFT_1330988 [Hesseltinella vesiculosa]